MRKLTVLSILAPSLAFAGFDEYVAGQVSVDFASKVLSYGLPDSDKPNLLPAGSLTFFDTLSIGSKFYIDLTNIGERMGRGNRTWEFWEIDFPVDLRHTFTPEEVSWLPTRIETGVGYRYEYHPHITKIRDTQFWVADIALPDLYVVPRLSYERDTIRDNGTYLNLNLSHSFEIVESVSLEPSVAQGWGDKKRVRGYLSDANLEGPLDRAGLMDTVFALTLSWQIVEGLTFKGFVAYSDFLFDRHIRESSRHYIRQIDGGDRNNSWTFPCGVSLTYNF